MAEIRPFSALRPAAGLEPEIAALPYDVYSRAEARIAAAERPRSFLRIDRAETQLPEDADMYGDLVYRTARRLLTEAEEQGDYVRDDRPCFYLYEQTFRGRTQTGIVACASIDEYDSGVIRRHENTRREKEEDRVRHVDALSAQTGPIFLCYRDTDALRAIVDTVRTQREPYCDFVSEGDVRNRCWCIREEAQIEAIRRAFGDVPRLYIADGHHRCASAVRVGKMRRAADPHSTGEEEYNYFLSVLFPDSDLMIMDYNRVIRDLGSCTEEKLLDALRELGTLSELDAAERPCVPAAKGEMILYLPGRRFGFRFREDLRPEDPVKRLDVSMLQELVLGPVLGITDPTGDPRLDFVGGIRGPEELLRRVSGGDAAAMAMYPTSMDELMSVADAGLLMPPKSTWFEPKLLSGLFIHTFG